MRMRRLLVLISIAISLGLLGLACAPKGQERAEQGRLKFTINSWIGWAPLYVALEEEFFGSTEVEIVRLEDAGARKSTMISGEVDGYASSLDNFALDSSLGVPGEMVLIFDESYGGDGIVVKESIQSIADLQGEKVAFQKGLPSHFLLLAALKEAGLGPEDVFQIDMDADKAGAAFVSGALDAAVTWEPWISQAAEVSGGRILLTTRDYPGLIVDAAVFRDDVLADRSGAVSDFINGWFRALDYWDANEADAVATMAKAYSLDEDEFRAFAEGVRFFDLAANKAYFGDADSAGKAFEVFNSAGSLWQEAGLVESSGSAMQRIDPTFVRRLE